MRTDNFINYKISTNNIHIADSFQYTTKKEMKEIIQYLKKLYPDHIVFTRSISSLVKEWQSHNLLYRLRIAKDRTKDIDLECHKNDIIKLHIFYYLYFIYKN